MKLIDRVLRESKRNDDASKKKKPVINEDDDPDNMGYMYDDHHPVTYLNEEKGVFYDDPDKYINTARSVFDRTAVFRVSRENDN